MVEAKGWYPFPNKDIAVATSSGLKTQLLFPNGIQITNTDQEVALVGGGEGNNPVIMFDREFPPFAARTAVRKAIPLQAFLRQLFHTGGHRIRRATFDSTNDLLGVDHGDAILVTNKHHGEQGNIDRLMDIYRGIARGAEFVSSTGITVVQSHSDLLELYYLRLRVGIWDPKNWDKLYDVVKNHPDFPGGMAVVLALQHEFVRTNGHVMLEASRIDDTPDLLLADKRGNQIAGRIINERHLTRELPLEGGDEYLFSLLRQLSIGIIPREIFHLIS